MIAPVKIRNIIIGIGKPKICLPIAGQAAQQVLANAAEAMQYNPDIIEFRCDYLTPFPSDIDDITALLGEIRSIIGQTVLLFTFRTRAEGGMLQINFDEYRKLNLAAAKSGYIDIADVEIFSYCSNGKLQPICDLINQLKACGIRVIGSHHRFDCTPDYDEIVKRLGNIEGCGADISKIAVMPHSPNDVLTLLKATNDVHEKHATKPIITMSMSGIGSISRISGEIFGSAVTFGCAGISSAPGQIEAGQLSSTLDMLHDMMR